MGIDARTALTIVLAWSLIFAACGGGSRPATSPPSESAPAGSASANAAGAETEGPVGASTPAGSAEAAPAAPPASKGPRPPREILELKDTIFFLSYSDSEAKSQADAACSKSAGRNAKKKAACVEKARSQIDGEGHHFEEDNRGHLWWFVVQRKGNAIVTLHKIRFAYGPQTDTTVVVKPQGKDMGSKPWKRPPAEVKFEVLTEYRIVLRDPTRGKLVYDAKSGIGGIR